MLKIGIFGTGHLGKFHLNNWKEIPGVSLIGFFDPNDDTAEKIINAYGLQRFLTEEELIEACDVVDVVAPTNFHFSICEKAVRKGKHVFVEKPMANTMEESTSTGKTGEGIECKTAGGECPLQQDSCVTHYRKQI
jgi:predicted dehydrogenase